MCRQVVVTGAAGFIGSHLTDRLLHLGWNVVGYDNLTGGNSANLTHARASSRFRFVEGDLLDFEAIESTIGNCDLIFHLAADPEVRIGAQNPSLHFKQNLLATFNLLEALRKRSLYKDGFCIYIHRMRGTIDDSDTRRLWAVATNFSIRCHEAWWRGFTCESDPAGLGEQFQAEGF